MPTYSKSLYSNSLNLKDGLAISANIGWLAVFYTFVGTLVSYLFYYLFDEYSPEESPPRGKEWETHPIWYKIYDISVEIVLIALISFWLTFFINSSAPIFAVRSDLSTYIDSYTTGMFFMYTVFLFMNDLTNKLMFVYEEMLSAKFDVLFPNSGSILNLSLGYKRLV